MIRVDSLEELKKLRENGFDGDAFVLFKGGEVEVDNTGEKDNTGEEDSAGEKDNTGEKDNAKEKTQFNYDKIVKDVCERLIPIIQKENRNTGGNTNNSDSDINDIMKKFAEM